MVCRDAVYRIVLILAVASLAPLNARAEDACRLTLVGELPGLFGRVRVDAGRAIVSQGELVIVDVSDPAKPAKLASIATGNVYESDIRDDLVVVTTSTQDSVRFFDISDPLAIQEWPALFAAPDADGFYGVAVENGIVAVATYGPAGVLLVKPSLFDPPVLLGTYPVSVTEALTRLTLHDERLILSGADGGERLVSITDPAKPVMLAQLRGMGCGHPMRPSMYGDLAVIAQSKGDCAYLETHDISRPTSPVKLHSELVYPVLSIVALEDAYAVATIDWGPPAKAVVELHAPDGLKIGAIFDENKNQSQVAASGSLLLVTNKSHGLRIYQTQPCYANCDCDQDAGLNVDDFVCFQTRFAVGDQQADCDQDGLLTVQDFVCFQTAYATGC